MEQSTNSTSGLWNFLGKFQRWDWKAQNMPPQNVSIWQVDHFELKGTKTQQTQEKLFTSSLTAYKNLGNRSTAITRDNFI